MRTPGRMALILPLLLAAVLLNNPPAFTVVLVEMLSVAAISMLILALLYKPFTKGILGFTGWVTSTNRNLAIFMFTIVGLPLLLMLL